MMGLMVLVVLAVYLLISVWVTKKATSWAKANNKKPWLWGGLAAFMMYSLVFWDLIPTLVMHKYYCSTQSGFWVYKTPEQWMKESPEMKEGVDSREQLTNSRVEKYGNGNKSTSFLNQRTSVMAEFVDQSMLPLLHITKREHSLIDTKKNYILIKKVTFEAGAVGGAPNSILDFRFWLNYYPCGGENGNTTYENWARADNKYANIGEEK